MATIGIIGNGYVGGATALLGKQIVENPEDTQVIIHDKNPDLSSHPHFTLRDVAEYSNFVFVCVPTPMEQDGSCSVYEVQKVVFELLDANLPSDRVIVKSTVPVGTCRELGVMFMPEFLTENKWQEDFINQTDWILGRNSKNDPLEEELHSIFKKAHSDGLLVNSPKMHFLTTEEAELVKYVRNCFLATKVSFFNEIYSFCEFREIDYNRVRDIVILDDRIGDAHTKVPGPDGKRGFGGTCFPKDMAAFRSQLMEVSALLGMDHGIVNACIQRNNKLDRPEKDWKDNKGRTVL